MHILVTNDDGPPSNQSSPYIHSLVSTLEATGHTISVIIPHQQRSWIGKAHIVGQTLTPRYFRPGTLHVDDGTDHDHPSADGSDWILIDGTPASCVQLGVWHFFKERGPVDLVLSGPNYGRNTTSVFALSSGTLGGAMEGAVCGKRSIALSYAFNSRVHDPEIIAGASRHSVKIVEYLLKNWGEGVELYSINVPVQAGVEDEKVLYTHMLDNRWSTGSCFEEVSVNGEEEAPEGQGGRKLDPDDRENKIREGTGDLADDGVNKRKGKKQYKWAPRFTDVHRSVDEAPPGNDGWAIKEGMTSVTPLRANFWHAPGFKGELKLPAVSPTKMAFTSLNSAVIKPSTNPAFYALVDYEDDYVQPLLLSAFKRLPCKLITALSSLPTPTAPLLQYRAYESLDFAHALSNPQTSLVNSYVIRKALIRKHYLSHTISSWLVKHPDSILKSHFKASVDFEIDYAEFLDEALVEAWELHESFTRNAELQQIEQDLPDDEKERRGNEKEWWILKPGMSDRGQGIRLFSTLDELQGIFEDWDPDSDSDHDDDDARGEDEEQKQKQTTSNTQGIITSHLRHFVAQPYIHPPLLLNSENAAGNRKFHLRVYVLAVGALKVYVYPEMLALFAADEYHSPSSSSTTSASAADELSRHLTNTCLQDGTREGSVQRFWELPSNLQNQSPSGDWKCDIFTQICSVAGEVFEAAARGQMVHFQPLPNAFELFGLDFLVDTDLSAWLLEVNAFPDMKQTGSELREGVVGGLIEEIVRVGVEAFFAARDGGDIMEEMEDLGNLNRIRLVKDIDMGRR